MDCDGRLIGSRGGKGQAAPAVGVGGVELGGLVEGRKGFRVPELADEVLAVADEEGGIPGAGGEQSNIEVVGAGGVAGVGQDFSQHAGDGGVAGVGVVELLEERQGLSLVLGCEDGGQLGGEGGVAWGLLEGRAEEGFGLGILLAGDEEVGQAGVGGGGFGVLGEDAAVGGFSGVVLAGLIGKAGGQERVGGGFGGEREGFEQVVGGFSGVRIAVDLGQGAPGAGFDGGSGVAGVEGGGSGQLLAGFGQIALTRQEQPEGEMGLKRLGIGIDGAAVEAGGRVQAVLGVGYVAGVEEGAGIGGMGGEPRVQFGFGGLPIGFDDGGLGVCALGGNGVGVGLGCGGELLFRIRRRGLGEPGCRGEEQD